MRHKLLLVAVTLMASRVSAQQPQDRFLGSWEGAIETGPARLRLGLVIERDSANALRGALISIDQGNVRLPGAVVIHGDTITVSMGGVGAKYEGVVNATRDSLIGTFTQGMPFPLALHRVKAIGGGGRPQDPKAPFPYRTKDVSFESVPGVRIAGTMVIPEGTGPFPAVVFVTGSGPQNRDEELMGHRPFLVWSDYLARRGIASLRTDDRGVGKSTGSFASATSADFANDAEAALRVLRADSAIDSRRVGIIGHSEGGMIGPMVAARSRDVAFLVLLAGPGLPGDSIISLQGALLAKASGAKDADIARTTRFNRAVYDIAKSDVDSATAIARFRPVISQFATELATVMPTAQPGLEQSLLRQTAPLLTPWYRYFLRYDPRPALRQVHVPVLAVNGTLDLQVPYREDLDAIKAALADAGNRDVTAESFPGLNHLFQTAKTGTVQEYSAIEETISPVVLDRVASWILQRFGKR